MDDLLSPAFRALAAQLGQDPLRVQGPGGNTSIKSGNVMWIKASGTELADAETKPIFVAVDRNAAKAEAGADLGLEIATQIKAFAPFTTAEKYHQNYYKKNPIRYNYYRTACGRDRKVKKLWGDQAYIGIKKPLPISGS